MIVMLCHFAPNGQDICIPMTPSPQIYYKSKQSCNDASIIKREEMKIDSRTKQSFSDRCVFRLYKNRRRSGLKP
jgi:hypothetical protein